MILKDDEVNERLSSEDNLFNRVRVVNKYAHLKGKGAAIGEEVQVLLGGLSKIDGSREVAETFEVGRRTVSNYENGVNGSNRINNDVKDRVTKVEEDRTNKAHALAMDALMDSLSSLRPKIPEISSAKELSRVARDMSLVANNLKPRDEPNKSNVSVVLMSVNQKTEAAFETIEVRAN